MKKFFSLLWAGWKKFAHVLGIVNTTILLSLTYFIIMAVAAIIARLIGADLLDRRMKPKETLWKTREQVPVDLDACKRQF